MSACQRPAREGARLRNFVEMMKKSLLWLLVSAAMHKAEHITSYFFLARLRHCCGFCNTSERNSAD